MGIRKILLAFITIVLIVILGWMAIKGANIGETTILSYTQLKDNSIKLKLDIDEYDSENEKKVKEAEDNLLNKIEEYRNKKTEYELLVERKKKSHVADAVDIDFLLVKVGNYASDKGLDLIFNVSKNVADANAGEYILTDLSFEVVGDYIYVADYIACLEEDDTLAFEIRDIRLESAGEVTLNTTNSATTNQVGTNTTEPDTINLIKATFKVYGIGINRDTLIEMTEDENNKNVTNSTKNKKSNSTNSNTKK